MSEELKRKLYNYEADPPETVWSKIAISFDEDIPADLPKKLYDLEIAPPITAWNTIEDELESDVEEFHSDKLYNLETKPPKEAWKKISAALDEEKVLPQISSKRKTIPFVRYAAAACIIGVIAFGAFKLLDNKTNKAVAEKTIEQKKDTTATVESRNQSPLQAGQPLSNNLPKEKPRLAQNNTSSKKRSSASSANYMTLMASLPSTSSPLASNFKHASLQGEVPGNCSTISEADRYLMFLNPDGYLIRMSKKLAETLGCVSPNQNSGYNQCQEQIKKWRDKIAQSPATSSPDNFMDLVDMIKSAQDN